MGLPPKFLMDYRLMYREPFCWRAGLKRLLTQHSLLMMFFAREGERQGMLGRLSRFAYLLMARKRGIQIDFSHRIGGGLSLAHAYCITVNSEAVLGNWCILYKGCTIGAVMAGKRAGVPRVGCRVVIGLNATVVGNVAIGNDVMIAPNAFVNFDVPDNSLVIGNPGVIHQKENPCQGHIPENP